MSNNEIHVEDIQDSVETILEQAGYTDVAKALYSISQTKEKIRNMKSILDYKEIVIVMLRLKTE